LKIDVKTEIRTALIANTQLTTLLGGQHIYQLVAPNAEQYPRITFFEVDNVEAAFADDSAYASDVFVQVDVWSKGSTSAIAGEVDETLKGLGYSRTRAPDFYEEETRVYHKAMRYRRQFEEV